MKMKLFFPCLLALLVMVVAPGASAEDEIDRLKTRLAAILSADATIDSVEATPADGIYIVTVQGQDMYVYSAGDYVMVGDVYDTVNRTNLGDARKERKMIEAIAAIPEAEMIMMGEPLDRHVTVFTDTDCFYCQKFHRTIPELQANGIQVRYLMFPRAGLESASYREAVSVWCAEDQAEAMTIAKAGKEVEKAQCENPVAKQFELGQQLGVQGTPTMVLDNGELIPGFLPPEQLRARM